MSTNEQDIRALIYLASRLRAETYGCGAWDQRGLEVKVAELKGLNLAVAVEQILRHATDPSARTPGAVLRPFKPPTPSEQPKGPPTPPKRHEQCTRCGGRLPACACTREHLAAVYDDEPHRERIADACFDAALARARLAEARVRLCGCGVRVATCPSHREAAVAVEPEEAP